MSHHAERDAFMSTREGKAVNSVSRILVNWTVKEVSV